MASKALPLLGFVLIVMLLVSAAVEAKDTTEKEKSLFFLLPCPPPFNPIIAAVPILLRLHV